MRFCRMVFSKAGRSSALLSWLGRVKMQVNCEPGPAVTLSKRVSGLIIIGSCWFMLAATRARRASSGDWECRYSSCLLYTSDAADDLLCVDLGGRRIIKKKN